LLPLPVIEVLPELRRSLAAVTPVVLSAPPGSGKTTLVPLELLQEPWLDERRIILLEPRRLAARAAAARMADLLHEKLGETVGYRTRLDTQVSSRTRIEVVTEGILNRRLQHDPELNGIGLVIFDEFHERSLQADLGLALTLDVMSGLRDDLRLLVMSATLDADKLTDLLEGAALIRTEGRSYAVTLEYLGEPPADRRLPEAVSRAIRHILPQDSGDLLVFLPGVAEIRQTEQRLIRALGETPVKPLICPLYADLSRADQDRAILPDPGGRRRVVLATSIAETSLTIEGVSAVLDSGWSRRPRFLPNSGLTRLETVRVSRAAAAQRAGRAGRLGPGRCYRLWNETRQASLAPQHPAEILEADLAPLMLALLQWGVSDPAQLKWLDPPPPAACQQGMDLLQALAAVDQQGRLTRIGQAMADLPLHPRLAHLLLRAATPAARDIACDLAALLSERDILRRSEQSGWNPDIEHRLSLLKTWRQQGKQASQETSVDQQALRRVDRVSQQMRRLLQAQPLLEAGLDTPAGLLAMAYPDRIAKQTRHARFKLASGRAAYLAEDEPLAARPYLVAAQVDAGRTQGRIWLAVAISDHELRRLPDLPLVCRESVVWDQDQQAVLARQEEHLGALCLSSAPLSEPDPQAMVSAMLEGIRQLGLESLPWDKETRQWRNRVRCLAAWQPDAGWPNLSDTGLLQSMETWLAPWLTGITRRGQLQKLDLRTILQAQLSWEQRQRLDKLAPTHLPVPSGTRKRLEYSPEGPPVLAVRLQELFGLQQTPTVCQGRVAVMLHLLSPAQRPIQVTQDLPGFWQRTYHEVKKELKGRYPKHYWPDDPNQAQATARVKPRGK
jgi:ATP-dependent helicase HrpB